MFLIFGGAIVVHYNNTNSPQLDSYIWLSHLDNCTCFTINIQNLLLSPYNNISIICFSNSFLFEKQFLQYPHCFMVFTTFTNIFMDYSDLSLLKSGWAEHS